MKRVNLWDGWRSKENYSNNKFTNCRPTTMNNETHEWPQDCKNGKDLYSYIKPFHAPERSAYIGVWPLIGLKKVFPPVFRELRCLRHKIHIGLFVTVGIADLTWLLTASLQVIGNVFAGERFQPDFQSIGTSPGTLETLGILASNFPWEWEWGPLNVLGLLKRMTTEIFVFVIDFDWGV